MGRSPLVAACALGLLTLSACSGSADPSPAPPPTSSTVASPSPSPSPAAPVMPEAAKAHTKAGAKAFVEHFWQVVNYAQATGDTDALSVLTVPECTTCAAGIESIREVHSGGGKIVGGEAALSDLSVAVSEQHSTHLATVTFQAHFAAQTTDYPGTRRDKTNIARRARDQFHLIAAGDSPWRVATFRVLQ